MSALIRHEKEVHKLDPRRQRMSSAELYGARVERTWSSRVVVADETSGPSDRDAPWPGANDSELEGAPSMDNMPPNSALKANDPHPSDGTTSTNSNAQIPSEDHFVVPSLTENSDAFWSDITSVAFYPSVFPHHEAEHLLNAQLLYQWYLSSPLPFSDESRTLPDISFSVNEYNPTDSVYYDFTGMPFQSSDL